MLKKKFIVDDVQYTVHVTAGHSIIFKATIENKDADGTWWDDELEFNTIDIVGGTKNPLKVYHKLAEATRSIIYGNNLKMVHFSVEDERRGAIYERFAKTVKGYNYQRIGNTFYLFKD